MNTYADGFGGFGGSCLGAIAAGLKPTWTIENDPQIAEVNKANLGHDVIVADLLTLNPKRFDAPNVMHWSPPCTRASAANSSAELNEDGTKEAPLDMALASKIIEFTEAHLPDVVTIENVWAYRHFQSWKGGRKCEGIQNALHRLGYWVSVEHCNAADYSVPQTRKRMIVRAIRGGFVPYLPEPTPWIGWYAAVADLIDTLPETQFAPWQLARLPELLATTLVGSGGFDGTVVMAQEQEPSFTVTANQNQTGLRAFLVSNAKTEFGNGLRSSEEPALTVTSQSNGRLRAFLMPGGGNTNFGEAHPGRGCRYPDEPAHTITATSKEGGALPKAWLVDGANTTEDQLSIREAKQPALTVTTGGPKHPTRSLPSSGKVVSMTPRCLARFQTIPDWYELPDNASLAAKGIGNACPPLLMQRIYEQLMGDL